MSFCTALITIDGTNKTATHTGRPLYRVMCTAHGLIHPGTTNPDWQRDYHARTGEIWATKCCEHDHDNDGNCHIHQPGNQIMAHRKRLFEQVESLRASGHVARWHVFPQLGSRQTVAEHSGQAVSLLLLLHPGPSLSLIKAMLWHDSAERIVGDVPAPVRRQFPEYSEIYEKIEVLVHDQHHPAVSRAMTDLTIEECQWLKAIDVLELVMHCHDLEMLGNRHAAIARNRACDYLKNDPNTPKIVLEFLQHYFTQDGGPRSFV